MSKNALTVTLKKTRMGWCVFLNGDAFAVGSHVYCQDVSKGLILRFLKHGPASMPQFVGQKGGSA